MQLPVFILMLVPAKVVDSELPFAPSRYAARILAMVWYDERYRYEWTMDSFFDRLIPISENVPNERHGQTRTLRATGVFITSRLVLTSYNPFKDLIDDKARLDRMVITTLETRQKYPNGTIRYYNVKNYKLECARQVTSLTKTDFIPSHMKHGKHLPVHDLLIFRLVLEVPFLKPVPKRRYDLNDYKSFRYDSKENAYIIDASPIHTDLAKVKDELGPDLCFASLGHVNERHVYEYRYLEAVYHKADENVIEDCDEWFPRTWGRFICILNTNECVGIASGGMLFSNEKLFGIGAFALFKGKKSILVFTDVRFYWDLMHKTCSRDDQNLIIPPLDNETISV